MKKDTLERDYLINKLSMKKIAEKHNISTGLVFKLIHEYEIPARKNYKEPNKGMELTALQEELVYAKNLGDGCITTSAHHNDYHFEFCHDSKQREYVKYCVSFLEGWGTYSEKERTRDPELYKKNVWTECVFKSCNHAEFSRIRRHTHEYGKKIVNRDILSMINEFGLAIWFMDDGHCERGNSGYINSMGFSKDENELIVSWLWERFKIRSNTVAAGKSRSGNTTLYRIRIIKSSWEHFCNIVEPHMHSSLMYKLGKDIVQPS
jgi:hypothetical protein